MPATSCLFSSHRSIIPVPVIWLQLNEIYPALEYHIYSNSSRGYTILFSLAWVQLPIEDCSYSRAAFTNFALTLDGVLHKIVVQKTGLRRVHFEQSIRNRRRCSNAAV